MTLHFPTIASASASRAGLEPRLWIVLQDTKHGTSCEHFFSEEARDEWARNWCGKHWKPENGWMPEDWRDAYAVLCETLEDYLVCPDPICLNDHPAMAMAALDDRTRATMLAALRLWHRIGLRVTVAESDIATSAGKFEPLSMAEINAICHVLGGAA